MTGRRYHLPGDAERSAEVPPEVARRVEETVRRAVRDTVSNAARGAAGTDAGELGGAAREPFAPVRARPGGYDVPSYDGGGRPVTVPVTRRRPGAPAPRGRSAAAAPPPQRPAAQAAARPAAAAPRPAGAAAARPNLGTGARQARPVTPARITGAQDDKALEAFLVALRRRMGPEFRRTRIARIDGSDLHLEGRVVRLVRALKEGEDGAPTVGTVLGEGAFYLDAVDREHTSLGLTAATVAGGAYRVQRVASDGRREDTGMRVITSELDKIPAGVLTYISRGTTTLQEITIRGRPRPDARTVAGRLEKVLDGGIAYAPASVITITVTAQFRGLDDDEVMEVLAEMQRRGRLGELFDLIRVTGFREFLRAKHVPFTYVFANWQPSLQDNIAFFNGVLVGAGENFYQVAEMIGILIGALFNEEYAHQAHAMWEGMGRLVAHPLVVAEEGLQSFVREFKDTLLDLRFFDGGRQLGNAVVTAITIWEAAGTLAKLGPRAARLGVRAGRVGVQFVRTTVKTMIEAAVLAGVQLEEFVKAAVRGVAFHPQLELVGGYTMAATEHDVQMIGSGKPSLTGSRLEVLGSVKRGELPFGGFTPAEIDELMTRLEKLEPEGPLEPPAEPPKPPEPPKPKGPPPEPAKPKGPPPEPAKPPAEPPKLPERPTSVVTVALLEDLVATAIRHLRSRLGSVWLTNTEFGNALHREVSALIKQRFPTAPPGLTIITEKAVSAFGHVPAKVLEMTVEDFVKQSANLRPYSSELSALFTNEKGAARLVKNLRVDLVIIAEGETVVWDLASVSEADHLTKTLLYAEVLRQEGHIVRVGETYWRHFGKGPDLRGLYPAAFEAGRHAKEKARKRPNPYRRDPPESP
jgi:hypothetical protein